MAQEANEKGVCSLYPMISRHVNIEYITEWPIGSTLKRRRFKQFYTHFPRVDDVEFLKIVAIEKVKSNIYRLVDERNPDNKYVVPMVKVRISAATEGYMPAFDLVVDGEIYYSFDGSFEGLPPPLTMYDRAKILHKIRISCLGDDDVRHTSLL